MDRVCQHVLQRLGESGQPPEIGITRINVGNETYLGVLRDEYFGRLLEHGSSFKLVQGYFGAGKTHFLYCVRELAWEKNFAVAVVELSPRECPYDDALAVFRAAARRISAAPKREMDPPNTGLAELIRTAVDRKTDTENESGRGSREVRRWIRREVGRTACESLSFRAAVTGLALAWLDDDEERERRFEAWLMGEPIPPAEMRELGVYESMNRANGFLMLRSMTQMLPALGFGGTALLFDEVDRNLSVSAKRSQAIGDNLRQVIDLCGRHQLPHTLFMYAVPPEFMRNVVPDYPALYQRLKSPMTLSVRSPQAVMIDLERLDLEPAALLEAIGHKVVEVFDTAHPGAIDRQVQRTNASVLGEACANTQFDVNHRRLFVKAFVDLLHRQAGEEQTEIDYDDALSYLQVEGDALAEVIDEDQGFEAFADI